MLIKQLCVPSSPLVRASNSMTLCCGTARSLSISKYLTKVACK
jgi:hypothetical protein